MTLTLVLLSVTVLIGAFVQGTSGLGFAMIFAPVAGLIEPGMLPVALLALMLPLNVYVMWRERSHLDWRGAGWVGIARVLSTPLGLWLLLAVPENRLALLFGGATVLAAVVSLLAPDFRPTRTAFLAAGAATGLSETATGIGGPPLALVYQHRPAPELRATVAACFLLGEIVSLALLLAQGRGEMGALVDAAWLLPALVVGLLLSSLVHERIPSARLRQFVLMFAVVSGVLLMVTG
jgi:uncharacterized protein